VAAVEPAGVELGLSAAEPEGIAAYVESCRLPDGGYFFARIPPSGLQDTYYAVRALGLLGVAPARPEGVEEFVLALHRAGAVHSLGNIHYFVEVLSALGRPVPEAGEYAARILARRNRLGGFGAVGHLPVEVPSELESTFHAVTALVRLGHPPAPDEVCRFVLGFQRPEGGFGGVRSSLASTYYAVRILDMVGCPERIPPRTEEYLRFRERLWDLYYLDRVYWLVGALHTLGRRPLNAERIRRFVRACRVPGRGFGRTGTTAISTLEDTCYALEVLSWLA